MRALFRLGMIWGWGVVAAQAATAARPVIVFLCDDLGPHLGCYGTAGVATPHLDQLAKEGMRFTRAYAPSASCSPSRAALLTGAFSHANGLWRNVHSPELNEPAAAFAADAPARDNVGVHDDLPNLPGLLGDAGYVSGITQKLHLNPAGNFHFTYRSAVQNNPDQFATVLRSWIRQSQGKPQYYQINIASPHRPFPNHLPFAPSAVDPKALEVPAFLPDTPAMRKDLADYLTCVQTADACVGACLQVLKDEQLYDNALIIATADQGMAYHRAKASAYDAGIRIPMIVRGPGVQGGTVSDDLVSLIDVFPTVCEWGLGQAPAHQGHSLWPALHQAAGRNRRLVIGWEHNSHGPNPQQFYPQRAVSDGRFTYILNLFPERPQVLPADLKDAGPPWFNNAYAAVEAAKDEWPDAWRVLQEVQGPRPREELYDNHTDPGQLRNLCADPSAHEALNRLRAAMQTWRMETGDTLDDPTLIQRRVKPPAKETIP